MTVKQKRMLVGSITLLVIAGIIIASILVLPLLKKSCPTREIISISSSNVSEIKDPDADYQYQGTKPTDEKDKGFKVVGYYLADKEQKLDRIQYDVVTHVIYAFAIPKEDGTLRPFDYPESAKALVKQAHENNTKVLMAVGGWSYKDIPLQSDFEAATQTEEKTKKFADAIINRAKKYGFDGIDMDWEHPKIGASSELQYEKLMVYLSEKCKEEKLLLTAAVISGVDADGVKISDAMAHSDKVLSLLDWVNVMAYDGGSETRHSPYEFAVKCGEYWRDYRKLPAEKVVVGVPFYARPSWRSYDDILKEFPDAYKSDEIPKEDRFDHYNGIVTMEKKAKWAKGNAGGVMIWELSKDTLDKEKSLLSAIKRGIQ